MSNTIFKNILYSEIEQFKLLFSKSSKNVFYDPKKNKIIHNAEFGAFRERIVKQFLRLLIPQRLEINSGFILTPKDQVSTQCDIIIYDSKSTPLIQDNENQSFYPVETVAGIGEVKSNLNITNFKVALNKLAEIKKLRADILDLGSGFIRRNHNGKMNLKEYPYDNIFSFLICDKLAFNIDSLDLNKIYNSNIEPEYRHNMILSIQDGLILYNEGKIWPYPISANENEAKIFIERSIPLREYKHFETFAHYMFMGLSSATIFYPEMKHYLY